MQFCAVAYELPLTVCHLREHESFVYVYDFNAWWRHEIRMERRLPRQHPGRLPVAGDRGEYVLDWFHIAMRVQNLEQMIKGRPAHSDGPSYAALIKALHGAHLWH